MKKGFEKYDLTARLLHWLSALVILWATISGLYLTLFNNDESIKHQISELNVSITAIFVPVFCWRVIHRIKHGVPSYGNLLSEREAKIARVMHILLYTLVTVVLLSGVLMMEKDFTMFNLFSISRLIDTPEVQEAFRILHMYSTRILAICIVLHVLASVKHEISGKRIFKRMI
ncbi:MAG: cytochrome b/b6 domain-containing protein [Candidatus Nitrotoga sp.]